MENVVMSEDEEERKGETFSEVASEYDNTSSANVS